MYIIFPRKRADALIRLLFFPVLFPNFSPLFPGSKSIDLSSFSNPHSKIQIPSCRWPWHLYVLCVEYSYHLAPQLLTPNSSPSCSGKLSLILKSRTYPFLICSFCKLCLWNDYFTDIHLSPFVPINFMKEGPCLSFKVFYSWGQVGCLENEGHAKKNTCRTVNEYKRNNCHWICKMIGSQGLSHISPTFQK